MSHTENRAAIEAFVEVWNTGNLAAVADFVSADYVRHDPGVPVPIRGHEGVAQLIALYRAAFPDLHFTAEVMLAEGDKVAVLWQVHGTHQGELLGIPATGKAVSVKAADFYRFAGGKVVEQWVQLDSLGLLQQLGVVPVPG